MNRAFVLLLHLGYWLLYLLLLGVIYATVSLQLGKPRLTTFLSIFPVVLIFITPNFISFYTSYFYLFPRFLKHQKFLLLISFGGLFCIISALLGSLISTIFYGFDQPIFNDRNEFVGFTVSLTLIATVHAVIALVIRGFITWFDEIKLKEELVQQNFETELALIKSQINPHFLFNTINNIDVLIAKDSVKASEYLNKLSDILRYMVYDAKNEKIPLTTEINYIEKYLELQKIRTANPNYINFEVLGDSNNWTIAPMIFFPFIENAFKHTEINKKTSKISVKISIKNNQIIFECENTLNKNVKKSDYGGLGNELISKRLMLLYPNKYSLEISDKNEIYNVKLLLEISANQKDYEKFD